MRQKDFIVAIVNRFPVQSYEALAGCIVSAMTQAINEGMGTFTYDGTLYTVTAAWKDGCINGNCNPATCYTNWEMTP